jgi:WD40 repeat protein
VSFHPEGQLAVAGFWDARLRVYDTFNKTTVATLAGHVKSVRSAAWSPSGRHIVSASLDGAVKVWSALSYLAVGEYVGHAAPITRIAFSPTGQELMTVSNDRKVKIWNGQLGQLVASTPARQDGAGAVTAVSLGASGAVLVGFHEGQVHVLDSLEHQHQVHWRRFVVMLSQVIVSGLDLLFIFFVFFSLFVCLFICLFVFVGPRSPAW